MNTEAEIVARLKQNITTPQDTVLAAAVSPVDTTYGQATTAPDFKLDEMTQYKLQDYFGEQYRDSDEIKRQQTQYIYEEVSKLIGEPGYGFVVAKIRDLERTIGISNSPERLFRMYQWLKLDKTRKNIEAEMGVITDG